MKMRFWQKTYLFTLALFLLCLNVGILSLTAYTYQKNVETTEAAVAAEQSYIAKSFERDYEDLIEMSDKASPFLLMRSFGTYYGQKRLYLSFNENGETLYSNFPSAYNGAPNTLTHYDLNGIRHIIISSDICDGKYQMIFAKNVSSLDTEFYSFILTYALTAAGVSLLLAICLYFVLKKLSAPLEKLRKATEAVEGGDFAVTVEEKGHDEFTLLAHSFNTMLAKINEQMTMLEKDANEKAVEAKRKQMLVDNLAHELRTPLTSIHGYAEYLEKANATQERRLMAAKYIISESARLQKISELLLDEAFIRENHVEMTDLSLDNVLTDVAQKLQAKARDHKVQLSCQTIPTTVKGNETLLSMLFYNLTENAIKACREGGKVLLSCENGQAVVEDNGKGMTQQQLSHITEPFYRTDKSRSRAEGGAGLGLTLCKQIVDLHRADMRFVSAPQKGTKIFITFTTPQ